MSELCILCTAHNRRSMSLCCQLPASCALAWAVQQFSDRHAHAQLSSIYLPSTARVGHVISESRLPPVLAQFTSGGRREPGDEAKGVIEIMQHSQASSPDAVKDTILDQISGASRRNPGSGRAC